MLQRLFRYIDKLLGPEPDAGPPNPQVEAELLRRLKQSDELNRVLTEALRRLVSHQTGVTDVDSCWDDYHAARMLTGQTDAETWDAEAAERGIEAIKKAAVERAWTTES